MKRLMYLIGIAMMSIGPVQKAMAQAQELEQLALDIEKLAQFKQILSDMKKGYDILDKGYSTIKGISQGSFDLHQGFLNGLLAVNPQLRNYSRISDIIQCQGLLLSEYRSAYGRFKSGGHFTPKEIAYLGTVYKNLFDQSLNNLDALTTVITDSRLRMSDDERLKQIDRIDHDMQDKLSFLRSFNRRVNAVDAQRAQETLEHRKLQQLYGRP